MRRERGGFQKAKSRKGMNVKKHLLHRPFAWLPIQLDPLGGGGGRRSWRWSGGRGGSCCWWRGSRGTSGSLCFHPFFCQVEGISLEVYDLNYKYCMLVHLVWAALQFLSCLCDQYWSIYGNIWEYWRQNCNYDWRNIIGGTKCIERSIEMKREDIETTFGSTGEDFWTVRVWLKKNCRKGTKIGRMWIWSWRWLGRRRWPDLWPSLVKLALLRLHLLQALKAFLRRHTLILEAWLDHICAHI